MHKTPNRSSGCRLQLVVSEQMAPNTANHRARIRNPQCATRPSVQLARNARTASTNTPKSLCSRAVWHTTNAGLCVCAPATSVHMTRKCSRALSGEQAAARDRRFASEPYAPRAHSSAQCNANERTSEADATRSHTYVSQRRGARAACKEVQRTRGRTRAGGRKRANGSIG